MLIALGGTVSSLLCMWGAYRLGYSRGVKEGMALATLNNVMAHHAYRKTQEILNRPKGQA